MDIKNSSSGKIIKTLTGYYSFIPHPLPPMLEWSNELAVSLSKANHVLGMLTRESVQLPNPHLLMRPFITREAVLSSKIEGTSTTLSEMLAKDVDIHVDRHPDDLTEVQNYILALDYGLERIKEFPLSLRLIKEIHEKLMKSVRGSHATPGEFRKSQNWIGSPGCTLNTAKYVPPIPEELMNCLDSFEKFLYDRMMPSLIHIALCHYQFEVIHPFLDGNGRIGRLLITILLIEHKLLPSPILYLSAFFEATRDEYYKQLCNVSSKGTWNEWLIYFLNGVIVQGLDVLSRAERINALIVKWQIKVGSNRANNIDQEIIKNLAVTPFCTINNISKKFDVAFTTAQRVVNKLEKLGIIVQTSTGKRDKIYCATEILNILEEPTKITENLDGTLI
ncbi:MAG TPA: Fic family protein [Rickettsia endosymbiont of Pyrocoelia pectoralis]|nr:Fic family protein [Rickettsia endosymbiont of Pyrocoelia pectoralis]